MEVRRSVGHIRSKEMILLSFFIDCLFFIALALCCCTWAFSTYSEQGLLVVLVNRLFIAVASLVAEYGF